MAMLMHGGVNYSGTTGSNTITLTQAEYDALPVEEKMDPEKVYYITDGVPTSTTVIPNPVTPATEDLNTLQIEETVYQIAGNGGSQIYDDTERVIGTWFGDTLYEKTLDLGNSVTFYPNVWTTVQGFSMPGCICKKAEALDDDGRYSNSFPIAFSIDRQTGQLDLNQFRSTTISVRWIVIRYTKVT